RSIDLLAPQPAEQDALQQSDSVIDRALVQRINEIQVESHIEIRTRGCGVAQLWQGHIEQKCGAARVKAHGYEIDVCTRLNHQRARARPHEQIARLRARSCFCDLLKTITAVQNELAAPVGQHALRRRRRVVPLKAPEALYVWPEPRI